MKYRCTNGHDRCHGGTSSGPDCPYCERIQATSWRKIAKQIKAICEQGDRSGADRLDEIWKMVDQAEQNHG